MMVRRASSRARPVVCAVSSQTRFVLVDGITLGSVVAGHGLARDHYADGHIETSDRRDIGVAGGKRRPSPSRPFEAYAAVEIDR